MVGLNMDGPITRVRSKRFQEKPSERLNSLIEEREEEEKLINFNQLLEKKIYFHFLIVF